METLLGSSVDEKNIALAKILFSLRHDLDIHCLIGVNAMEINQAHPGKWFLGHVAMRVLESIVLAICKVYEDEKGYELNSIQGVLNSLSQRKPRERMDESTGRAFVKGYGGPSEETNFLAALQITVDRFKKNYSAELDRFKTARDKGIAHSEYQVTIKSVPSFDAMEKLFYFGAEFYAVISNSFVGGGSDDLKNRREIKRDFQKVLNLLGVRDIKTEME